MNSASELVYSNDLCSAFVTAIVRSFERNHPSGWLGRTATQKLTYFARVLGVPIPVSFGIYTYGPYSDTVSFAVESLLADEVLVDQSRKSEYSNYRLGPNSEALLLAFDRELRPHLGTIDRIVKSLGGFKPAELELIATLHFIAQKLPNLIRRKATKKEIVKEFKSIKGEKFSEQEISAWYDALVQAGLI
jgi:uncharacterized protein YwgA